MGSGFGQAEESAGVARRALGDGLLRFAERRSDRAQHFRQPFGFVAAGFGPWPERAGQKIRRIGLDHQPIGGNRRQQFGKVRAPPFVADPAGDADIQIQREQLIEFVALACEAVCNGAYEPVAVRLKNRDEVVDGVALVQEHRLLELRGELQLCIERGDLGVARREIPIVVEPAFPDRDDVLRESDTLEFTRRFIVIVGRMVRVHAGGRIQYAGPCRGECLCRAAGLDAGTRNDQLGDAGVNCRRNDLVAVCGETVVGQVCTNVNKFIHIK